LIVLTASAPYPASVRQGLGINQVEGERLGAVWQKLQDEEASWSTRSRHWLVGDAHHYIQFDRPDAVIRAVDVVVEAVRRGAAPDPQGAVGLPHVTDVTKLNDANSVASGSSK